MLMVNFIHKLRGLVNTESSNREKLVVNFIHIQSTLIISKSKGPSETL